MAERSVVVTGGSRGIGYEIAQAFLRDGAQVLICGVDGQRLENARRSLSSLGEVHAVRADVCDFDAVRRLEHRARERLGEVDVLVNNAGRLWVGPFAGQPRADIDAVLHANLTGTLYVTRCLLPAMLERGSGRIINVSSGAGLSGFADVAVYCAAKFGVVGFTQSLAQELDGSGVQAYAVCPGRVRTDMQAQLSGRPVGMAPSRVAKAVLRLAGPRPPARPGECLTLP